jgi:dTDP-glucose pyrophosphorylase
MKNSSKNKKAYLKALILAGGRGKRLNSYMKEENKCMLKFGEKHLIEYSLENAVKLNVEEIIIVVGHLAERIINTFGNSYKGVPIKYVIQWEQQGLVHAIACSKNALDGSDFVLFLGDEFLPDSDHRPLLEQFSEEEACAVCGVIKVDDIKQISKTYSILFDHDSNRIFRLIEKPSNPQNNIMGTGNIIFKNEIFDYIESTPINQQRNEKELPDLIQCAIDDGKKILYHYLSSPYVNVNTPDDVTIIENITKQRKKKQDE